jgi:phosphoenolpyruvate carboxykinase (GTP)
VTDRPAELSRLKQGLEKSGELKQLNQTTFPGCHIAYSHPSDVARVEHLTFICTRNKETRALTTTGWTRSMRTQDARAVQGCMKGRTLYVVPYCMGPIDSPYSRCGVEITDSAYVVINMSIMTRMGRPRSSASRARRQIREGPAFHRRTRSESPLHHALPRELSIESYGSVTAATRCSARSAMRCASRAGRRATKAGWPSTCSSSGSKPAGRDALHRRRVSRRLRQDQPRHADSARLDAGWKCGPWATTSPGCIPDPTAACTRSIRGRLLRRGARTNRATNRNAFDMIHRDTLFTNVALTADNEPWWEGPQAQYAGARLAGQALRCTARRRVRASEFALHGIAKNNPIYSPASEDSLGVPISALVFGGRRREVAPLVYEARDWQHGVLVGASVASETTAAATGAWVSCAAIRWP